MRSIFTSLDTNIDCNDIPIILIVLVVDQYAKSLVLVGRDKVQGKIW